MAQDFSCTDLIFTRSRLETMWADANFRKAIQPEVDIVTALQDFQSANLQFFDNDETKSKLKIYWTEACEGAVQDCTTDCDFTGTNVSSNCKDYEITNCKETILTITDTDFYDNFESFQNALAEGIIKHTTLLDNWINEQVIMALDSFAGVNKYTGDNKGDVVGTDTFIEGHFWNPSLIGYFEKVKRVNYMPEAMMFSGENMWDHFFNSDANADNANGKGNKNLFDKFGWHFDLINMDVLLGAKKTLMVSPHSAAFVSTNRIIRDEDILNGANMSRFKISSLNIPGVEYDVYYRTECLNAGEDIRHHWRFVARMDTFQSPVVCDNDQTGILSFTCGVAP